MADSDRWAAECYRRGNDAMNKQNWGLAVEMFSTCVKLKPENLAYRQLLRNSTKKKYNDNGKGAGALAMTKLMGIRSRIKKAKAASDWEEVSKACEEGFLLNPWDPQFNSELAEASLQLDRGEIAKFSLSEACKAAPKEKAPHVALANLLRERAEYDDAIKVWERVSQLDPSDLTAMRRITELQTEKTTHRGGYEAAANTREVMSQSSAAIFKSSGGAAPGQDQETDLKHAIRKDPQNVQNYIKLAGVQKSSKKFAESFATLQKAFEVSGQDAAIAEQMEDAELLLAKNELDELKERANQSGDDAARKEVVERSLAFRNRRIEVLTSRVERYPANLQIKLQLAELLMQLGKWTQSIPLLQKASQDPRLKVRSLVALGECFVYDKKSSLARGQFERAAEDVNFDTDPELYKKCHYLLARVCEELGDKPVAEKHYGEVLVVDYEYKDARERLEKLQSS